MIVRLIKAYQEYEVGKSYEVSDETAQVLISAGFAEKSEKSAEDIKKDIEAGLEGKIEKSLCAAMDSMTSGICSALVIS